MALTLSVVSFSLDSCRQKGVIEEDVLSQIYAEMLMTDQWISSTAGVRLIADTSLVYEPILKKYGYTSADYRNSVEHYLKDPEEYADIMQGTVEILDRRLAELRKQKGEQQLDKERLDYIKKIAKDIRLSREWIYVDKLTDERYGMIDSLSVVWDSLSYCYTMVSVPWSERKERVDSLSANDSISALDSIPALDSLQVLDSLALPDSLEVRDSLPQLDTVVNFESVRKQIPMNGFDMSKLKKN
jgi:hypothetical protein